MITFYTLLTLLFCILIGVDVPKSLDAVIFAGEGNHQVGKEVIAGSLSHGGLNSTANCSAVLVDENGLL
jgi:hypothetical protein